jgi:hypothetical protein
MNNPVEKCLGPYDKLVEVGGVVVGTGMRSQAGESEWHKAAHNDSADRGTYC